MSYRRLLCVFLVVVSVCVCVEPRVWSLQGSDDTDLFPADHLVDMVIWPVVYATSHLPLAVYCVVAERELKSNKVRGYGLTLRKIAI